MRAVSLVGVAILGLAFLHKIGLLRGSPEEQPLLAARALGRSLARAALVGAALAELVVALLLIERPAIGFGAFTALLIGYTSEFRRLDADQPCGCFGEMFDVPDRRAAVRRNAGLVLISAIAGLAYAGGAVAEVPISSKTLGVALVFVAAIGAPVVMRRTLSASHDVGPPVNQR
jgi:hypothetical protein